MSFLFPYRMVSKGSKVILYGAGNVGRDFCMQIRNTGYCELEAWVDRLFDAYSLKPPFDYVANICKHEFDHIVVAVSVRRVGEEIVENLKKMGIAEEKIVWALASYKTTNDQFPMNKKLYLENFEFFEEIMEEYLKTNTIYGLNKFYESYTELGIAGVRDTNERLALYKIRDYLKKTDSVLDIGCNLGFLDMQVAPYVNDILGIDINSSFISIANKVKNFMKNENVKFLCNDFYKYQTEKKFDAIFSFAVHSNLMLSGSSAQEYVDKLYELLNERGHIFFESHNMQSDADRFRYMCKKFEEKGLIPVLHQNYFSDFERDIVVYEKK